MQSQTIEAKGWSLRLDGWRLELACSVLVALLLLAMEASQGFKTLFDSGGDNDAMMRVAQIRDLVNGQGWFDLHQYRMGVEGGFLFHWSRIVDTPIAAMILIANAITGDMALSERIAFVIWPTLLFVAVMMLLLRTCRQVAGPDTFLPTLVIASIAMKLSGMYAPRSIDHHNLQLALALATITLLLNRGWRSAAAAGFCCAAMLGIGMETLPYVAVAGGCVAVAFIVDGRSAGRQAIAFGAGFALSAVFTLLLTVPIQSWWAAQCDSYSAGLGTLAVGGGLGLAAVVALTAGRSLRMRTAGILVLGGAAVAAAIVLVPDCFHAPYSSLDPKLKKFWIDAISEAQPLWKMIMLRTDSTPQNYATPLIGAAFLILTMYRTRIRYETAVLAAFLCMALMVSIWQVRGANFSIPFAIIATSGWILAARRQVENHQRGAAFKLVGTWLLSTGLVWGVVTITIADIVAPDRAGKAAAEHKDGVDVQCYADATFKDLARQPATTVLTVSNLGAQVLSNTPHRSLSGPSHRNITGNSDVLDALMGSPDQALAIARRDHVGLVAFCPGNPESSLLQGWAPNGLMGDLLDGNIPGWLDPVPETMTGPLKLYRVR